MIPHTMEPLPASSMHWPNTQPLRNQISLPLTLPLHPVEPPSVVSTLPGRQLDQYRCHTCKAFINWCCQARNNNEYVCAICGCTNKTPAGINAEAVEWTQREYWCRVEGDTIKPNNTRVYAIVVDVAGHGVNYVGLAVRAVRNLLASVQEQAAPLRIVLIAYDTYTHVYSIGVDAEGHPQLSKHTYTAQQFHNDDIAQMRERCFLRLPESAQHLDQALQDIAMTSNLRRVGRPDTLMEAVELALRLTCSSVGKIFVVSGLDAPPSAFLGIENEAEEFHEDYEINRDSALGQQLLQLVDQTHMSVSFFILNSVPVNLLPLFAIARQTNGQLRHYLPEHASQFLHELNGSLLEPYAYETVLKVRYSSAVKLVSIFGQYRPYKLGSRPIQDQIELITCGQDKLYVFEFNIQGKIQLPSINVQFSILYTDGQGRRWFRVLTHSQQISDDVATIVKGINYGTVNQSYLWAVLHNMNLRLSMKNLQLTLQQRCRTHLRTLKTLPGLDLKRASPYIVFTFFLLRHYILNTKYARSLVYDKSIEARSRILANHLAGIHTIWPLVWAVDSSHTRVVDMRRSQIEGAQLAVVVNQGDFVYLWVMNRGVREGLALWKPSKQGEGLLEAIRANQELKPVTELIEKIQEDSPCGYAQVMLMENLDGVCILDEKGRLGYDNFVSHIAA